MQSIAIQNFEGLSPGRNLKIVNPASSFLLPSFLSPKLRVSSARFRSQAIPSIPLSKRSLGNTSGKRSIETDTYVNGINAEFWLHLCVFLHDCSGKFKDGLLVAPGFSSTPLVHFSLVQHFVTIDVNEMIRKLSIFRRCGCFGITDGFVCPPCLVLKGNISFHFKKILFVVFLFIDLTIDVNRE